MAEKNAGGTYAAVIKELRAGRYAPVYLLAGDEPYYIDQVADYIAGHALPDGERDFNQIILYGADSTGAQVADLAREFPMMSARRVVIVREAQGLSTPEPLAAYLSQPVATTILVLCYKGGKIPRTVLLRAKAAGVYMESRKKRDYELPDFIEAHLREAGVAIDRKAAAMMAESVGADLARLVSELDKLTLSLPKDDRRVTPERVERGVGVSKEYNVFELKKAIIDKDVVKANRIITYFDKNPKAGSLYAIVPVLFTYFQNLFMAYYATDRTNENSVATFLDLKSPWQAKEYVAGMRHYTARKAMNIIHAIRKTDARSKGMGNVTTSATDLARELLFFILH